MDQGTFDFGSEEAPPQAGLCECGCGEPAPIAKVTSRRAGYVAGEPVRFIRGHARRGRGGRIRATELREQFVKLCECGCGEPAPLAKVSSKQYGHVAGQPMRFIHGHNGKAASKRAAERHAEAVAQSDKLCGCGCGEPAPIATYTSRKDGIVMGEPLRFILGHAVRLWSAQLAATRPAPEEVKLCKCGCGEPAPIATRTDRKQRTIKGHPQDFIAGHHVMFAAHFWKEEAAQDAERTSEETLARKFRIAAVRMGIDPGLIVAYRANHDNLCEICGSTAQEANPAKTRLCIDHDHATGEFRGLLCTRCNVMIGNALDNPEILLAAVAYLRRARPARAAQGEAVA